MIASPMPLSARSGSLNKSAEGGSLEKFGRADAPILITMGEPSGIGPEVALAAFAHFGGKIGARPLKLVGDAKLFAPVQHALIPTNSKVAAVPGKPAPANA